MFCTPDALPQGDSVLSDYEQAYCSPADRALLTVLRSLPDADLLAVARTPDGPEFAAVLDSLFPGTERAWVTLHAACTAWDRDLISESELDSITG